MNPDALLDQLRDIHYPEQIGWWPPAPGWWLLAITLLTLSVILLIYLVSRRRRLFYKRQARKMLADCWAAYLQDNNDRRYVEDLLALVRRIAKTSRTAQHLEAMGARQLITLMTKDIKGAAAGDLSGLNFENLLYHPQPMPLSEKQARYLQTAVEKWLKDSAQTC
jgi:hypothetical protein